MLTHSSRLTAGVDGAHILRKTIFDGTELPLGSGLFEFKG